MLRTRLVTAAILAPLILAVVFLGEPWLSIMVGALGELDPVVERLAGT